MNSLIQLKRIVATAVSHCLTRRVWLKTIRGVLLLCCFALCSTLQASGVHAPDGGFPGANTAEGDGALEHLTTGVWDTALGFESLAHLTTGNQNTGVGFETLFNTTTGSLSVAVGSQTLYSNTTGSFNTATGFRALYTNTIGTDNTANGFQALTSNTTGIENTAIGSGALQSNTTGPDNTAVGDGALENNTTGANNTATGNLALQSNTTGFGSAAIGFGALQNNTTGSDNTAHGHDALVSNTTGSANTGCGYDALQNNTTGNSNIALGNFAGIQLTTGSSNIDIGNEGLAGESNTVRIGDPAVQNVTFIAGVRGTTTGMHDAIPVAVDSTGQFGTVSSSRRFKTKIKPMDQNSEALLRLRPVTFQYKNDTKGVPQFGLIAEEVAEVNPDLVVCDADGKFYTVRYDAVNAMLLNEFLKEHRKVEEQEATMSQLKATVAKQEATIARQQKDFQATATRQQERVKSLTAILKEQASQIQRVSAQVEMNSQRQIVANDQ
jgi:hypothetical protein